MPLQKFKVLLIEDDSFLASLYTTKFTNEGFLVIQADCGEDGLKLAKQKEPDVILLDLLLPGMNGFSVLETLKDDAALAGIPVVILTNLSTNGEVKKGIELGACDYLVKSNFLPGEVVEKVRGVIANR